MYNICHCNLLMQYGDKQLLVAIIGSQRVFCVAIYRFCLCQSPAINSGDGAVNMTSIGLAWKLQTPSHLARLWQLSQTVSRNHLLAVLHANLLELFFSLPCADVLLLAAVLSYILICSIYSYLLFFLSPRLELLLISNCSRFSLMPIGYSAVNVSESAVLYRNRSSECLVYLPRLA